MPETRWLVGVPAAVVFLAFGYFVWPTPYRDVQLPGGLLNGDTHVCCYAARANRFTAEVQVLTIDGWQSLSLKGDVKSARAAAQLILPPSPP